MIGSAALYALAALTALTAAPPGLAAKDGTDAGPRFLERPIRRLAAHARNVVAPGVVGAAQNIGILQQTVTVEVDNRMDTGGGAVYPKDTVTFLKQLPTLPVGRATGDVQAMRKQGEDIYNICQRQKVADPDVYRALPCFVYEEDPLRKWEPRPLPPVAALTPVEAMRCTDATALAKESYFPLIRHAGNNYKVATPLPIHQNNAEAKDYDELFEMAASGAFEPKDFEAERRSRGDGHDYLEVFCVNELGLEVEDCGIDLDVVNGDVFEAWFVCPAAMAYAQPHAMPHGSGRLHLLDDSWRGTMNPSDPFTMGYLAGDGCLTGSIRSHLHQVEAHLQVRAKLSEEDIEFLMSVKARIGGAGAVTVFDHKAKLGYYSIVEFAHSGSEGLKYLATNWKYGLCKSDQFQLSNLLIREGQCGWGSKGESRRTDLYSYSYQGLPDGFDNREICTKVAYGTMTAIHKVKKLIPLTHNPEEVRHQRDLCISDSYDHAMESLAGFLYADGSFLIEFIHEKSYFRIVFYQSHRSFQEGLADCLVHYQFARPSINSGKVRITSLVTSTRDVYKSTLYGDDAVKFAEALVPVWSRMGMSHVRKAQICMLIASGDRSRATYTKFVRIQAKHAVERREAIHANPHVIAEVLALELLEIPSDFQVHYVDDVTKAQGAVGALAGASVVGFDAEWEPHQPVSSPAGYAATVQFATRDDAVVLDLVALSRVDGGLEAANEVVASALSGGAVVVGFMLDGDLARGQPVLSNLATLAPDKKLDLWVGAGGGSLAQLVREKLYKDLDKSLQRSAWGSMGRPLSRPHINYAALDAYACVLVYSELNPPDDDMDESDDQPPAPQNEPEDDEEMDSEFGVSLEHALEALRTLMNLREDADPDARNARGELLGELGNWGA